MKKASIVGIAILTGIACVGCGAPKTSEFSYDNGKGSVKISEDQPLPPGFALPKYTNSKVIVTTNTDQGAAQSANMSTKDAPSTVAAFYKDFFTTNGWTIGTETNMGGQGTIIMAEKGDLSAQLVIATDTSSGETSIQVIVSKKGS